MVDKLNTYKNKYNSTQEDRKKEQEKQNWVINAPETQRVIDRISHISDLAKQYKLLQFLVFHWLILRRVMSSVDLVPLTISTFDTQTMFSARCH